MKAMYLTNKWFLGIFLFCLGICSPLLNWIIVAFVTWGQKFVYSISTFLLPCSRNRLFSSNASYTNAPKRITKKQFALLPAFFNRDFYQRVIPAKTEMLKSITIFFVLRLFFKKIIPFIASDYLAVKTFFFLSVEFSNRHGD